MKITCTTLALTLNLAATGGSWAAGPCVPQWNNAPGTPGMIEGSVSDLFVHDDGGGRGVRRPDELAGPERRGIGARGRRLLRAPEGHRLRDRGDEAQNEEGDEA